MQQQANVKIFFKISSKKILKLWKHGRSLIFCHPVVKSLLEKHFTSFRSNWNFSGAKIRIYSEILILSNNIGVDGFDNIQTADIDELMQDGPTDDDDLIEIMTINQNKEWQFWRQSYF